MNKWIKGHTERTVYILNKEGTIRNINLSFFKYVKVFICKAFLQKRTLKFLCPWIGHLIAFEITFFPSWLLILLVCEWNHTFVNLTWACVEQALAIFYAKLSWY